MKSPIQVVTQPKPMAVMGEMTILELRPKKSIISAIKTVIPALSVVDQLREGEPAVAYEWQGTLL